MNGMPANAEHAAFLDLAAQTAGLDSSRNEASDRSTTSDDDEEDDGIGAHLDEFHDMYV